MSIGVFDGVHRGHQALIGLARRAADERGLPLIALTFDPHPMSVVGPRVAPPSLAGLELRQQLLRRAGADRVEVLEFDEPTSQLSPHDFVERVLVNRLHTRAIVVGEDFRFGHRAAGSVDTLREESQRYGFDVLPAALVGDGEQRWSSTRIRTHLVEGEVAAAAEGLGRLYRVDGRIVHGDHRGRELGFPTANLAPDGDPAIPADGVYAGWIERSFDRLPAAISVGTNPTFDGEQRRIEAYAIDRTDLDLYGEEVGIAFDERIRGQARFDDVAALVTQMHADVAEARRVLATETDS